VGYKTEARHQFRHEPPPIRRRGTFALDLTSPLLGSLRRFVDSVTDAGRKQLATEVSKWARLSTGVASKSGIDNPTCDQTAPCATVHHAVTIANAGDIVRIAKGTYKESTGIVIGKNLTVEGAGSFTTYVPKRLER
jgi:hypothetical protein